jgi:hypothetical protein
MHGSKNARFRLADRPADFFAWLPAVPHGLASVRYRVGNDDTKVSFEADRVAIDGKTGKPVADVTRYIYHDADTRHVVSFERQKTILQAILTDRAPLLKRIIARLIGFDGAYHRFTGQVTVEKFEGDMRVERFDDHAIWELMYFGKARRQRVEI